MRLLSSLGLALALATPVMADTPFFTKTSGLWAVMGLPSSSGKLECIAYPVKFDPAPTLSIVADPERTMVYIDAKDNIRTDDGIPVTIVVDDRFLSTQQAMSTSEGVVFPATEEVIDAWKSGRRMLIIWQDGSVVVSLNGADVANDSMRQCVEQIAEMKAA